jgi:hypothetical protein
MPADLRSYYFERVGSLFVNPTLIFVRATSSASGATWTVSTTRRQSHPVVITGSSGQYSITGIPSTTEIHGIGIALVLPSGTELVNQVTFGAVSPSTGTLAFVTRNSSSGAAAAPTDGTVLYATLMIEGN